MNRHDREAAYSQGVTHFVGRMLDELKLQKTQLATVGYTKLLEIVEQTCNDPLQLFLDLQRYNPYAQQMHNELNSAISTILALLTRMDDAPMEDLMTVRLYTLGCKLNQCESEAIADAFVHQGFDLAGSDEESDIYIINTCTVTSKAEQKARRMARLYHRVNPQGAIIITGCYAQMEQELLQAISDRVIVVSLDDKPGLLTLPERLSKRLIADFDLVEAIRDSLAG